MKRLITALTIAAGAWAGALADDNTDSWPATHFAWGAEVASDIDMTGQDLSTFDIHATLGYKNRYIQMLGAGAGIDVAIGNSSRMYPVYGVIRTSFNPTRNRCFMEVRAGYSFNHMTRGEDHNGIYTNIAWCINLAMAREYRSYLGLGYTYRQLGTGYRDLSCVSASFGISF